jgi:dTDP-4-amino-4,6-dideoxygalactose transaminase
MVTNENQDGDDVSSRVPVMLPRVSIHPSSLERLGEVARSQRYSNFGPQVDELELRFAAHFGVDKSQVVVAANATQALVGSLSISPTKHWRLPSWTFVATAHAVLNSSKTAEFIDVDSATWMMPVENENSGETGNLVVLPFGRRLEAFEWEDSTQVIVDAAASFGSMEGALSNIPRQTTVVFSLHATKVLGVGEGSVSVFGDAAVAKEFRSWTNFGFSGSRIATGSGSNAKMDEFTAALIHGELDQWPAIKNEWQEAREKVQELSAEFNLETPDFLREAISPYWIVKLPSMAERNRLEAVLKECEIESRRWWGDGCHRMPAFGKIKFSDLNATENLASTTTGLPLFRGISETEIGRLRGALRTFIEN